MAELKPKLRECPFCGDIPTVYESKGNLKHILYSVCCYGDHHTASMGWFDGEEEAIEAWNRRSDGK